MSSSLSRYSTLSSGVPVLTEMWRLSSRSNEGGVDPQSLIPLRVVKITMAVTAFGQYEVARTVKVLPSSRRRIRKSKISVPSF